MFDSNNKWCDWCHEPNRTARVDEVKPTVAGNPPRKYLAVKSVNSEFLALPILYSPVDNSSWAPPYVRAAAPAASPLFTANETCMNRGFEEPTLFKAEEDGFLHFIGHNHGRCAGGKYAHFISRSGSMDAASWVRAPLFGNEGNFIEPVPVPLSGDGVFGGAIATRWIDFGGYSLNFANTTMVWSG